MDGEDRGGGGYESRAGRGGAGSDERDDRIARSKSRDNVGRFIRAGGCPRVPGGRGERREAGVRTWTKRRRRAMAIGERALTARTAAPSRPAAPERRCARLRLEDDADHPEEVEAAPPRAVAQATVRRADARGATGTEASPAVGRATVAALTDIFRVVRVVGLFALDARKGGENFRSREKHARRRVQNTCKYGPRSFSVTENQSWCPRESPGTRDGRQPSAIPTPVRRPREGRRRRECGHGERNDHRQRQRP